MDTKNMKRISISITGVLRDITSKLITLNNKYNEREFEGELPDLDLVKHLEFDSEEDLINFMYVECPLQLFGYSNELEEGSFYNLNEFYKKFRDEYEIVLVSEEIEKSKPATLVFLAKHGSLIDRIEFYPLNKSDKVWDKTDIFVTSEELILNKKPSDKTSIKFKNKYNKDIKSDFTIKSIKNLSKLIDENK
tara:strand:- start:1828 stop:2403 length:576 start_codon:yes stop_codon:yes gene_type:complete